MDEQPTSKTLGDYIVILVGHTISSFGSIAINFAILGWIMCETMSSFYLTLASFLSVLPLVIFLPLTGVLSDILNRKKVLIITSALHILTTSIFIFLFESGIPELITLFIFLLINSIFQAFYLPTFFAIIPSMVSQRHLGRINGLAYFLTALTLLFAPYIAGILFCAFPINQQLWVGVIANGIMLIIVILIKIPQVKEIRLRTKDHEVKSSIIHYFQQFIEGFNTMIIIPGILILFGAIFILELLSFPFNTLLSYYFYDIHNVTAFEYSIILFNLFLGMVIGTIIYVIKKYWNPVILIFFLSLIFIFLGNLVILLAPYRSFDLIFITFFIKGIFLVFVNTIFLTLIQSNIPKNKLGRVSAIYFSIASSVPLYADFLLRILLSSISDVMLILLLTTIVGIISMILLNIFTGIRKIRFENYKIIENTYN